MTTNHEHEHDHDGTEAHDLGLAHDLRHPRHRRAFLGLLGAGATTAVSGALLLRPDAATATTAVAEIPTETSGPYPGDGSNGPDILTERGIVRSDIRRSFGTAHTRAYGQPFRFKFKLVDTADQAPLAGLAVYAWHCNRDGEYSMYGDDIADQNYLRGVQVSDSAGRVRFESIFPACYSGRWPHVHFEVYRNLAEATGGGTPVVTSQMALPRTVCSHVYAHVRGYEASVTNLNRVSLASDNVFGDDGGVRELATMRGSIQEGYRAKLLVPVEV